MNRSCYKHKLRLPPGSVLKAFCSRLAPLRVLCLLCLTAKPYVAQKQRCRNWFFSKIIHPTDLTVYTWKWYNCKCNFQNSFEYRVNNEIWYKRMLLHLEPVTFQHDAVATRYCSVGAFRYLLSFRFACVREKAISYRRAAEIDHRYRTPKIREERIG